MATVVSGFNLFLLFIFSLCYMYQAVYVVIVLVKDHKKKPAKLEDVTLHRYAVLISGRNEKLVIGELVKSLKNQDYPEELIDIFVIADNCTDNTAEVAREAGAHVFVRNNKQLVGKSYALDYAIKKIFAEYGDENGHVPFKGFFVFDADNVIDPGFVAAMNRGINKGYKVLTSYRNSKNYDSNWVSAGSALWFLREAKFLSNARQMMGSSCAISGTGFLIDSEIIERNKGWIHHLLTEDIEFSTDCISSGIRIGYCSDAILYDEQPLTMRDSWRQRLRWAKGFYQVLLRYGSRLSKGILKVPEGRWACFDMTMTIAPAMLLVLASVFVNLAFCLVGLVELASMATSVQSVAAGTSSALSSGGNFFSNMIAMLSGSWFHGDTLSTFNANNAAIILNYTSARSTIIASFLSFLGSFASFAFIMFVFGIVTTIVEWDKIHAKPSKKIKYLFTFPFFMLTYVPIALVAVFSKVEWKPIKHNVVRTTSDIINAGK